MPDKKITLTTLRNMKQAGEKFACLTAYDATFARLLDDAGVEVVLVGDSLGMVVQGQESTLPVTMDEMIYHTHNVSRGCSNSLVLADMSFMSYATPDQAMFNAGRLMAEGHAHAVKLEGGAVMVETVKQLTAHGIPVCAHLGLLPQSVNKLGGYRVQGKEAEAANTILQDSMAMQEAGADLLLFECIPSSLAAEITSKVDIPVIGIGAGVDCDAQVLVLHDMLGITPGKRPKFSKNFMEEAGSIQQAISNYVKEVKAGTFPGLEHSFS
ncbi:MAG: 3-methyl-2-oxobutanoate hydroxymethyltransferase [Gammaproteobacteria bacterium]|nr:3-methyl-2-oxobutanoate hydroxymethyltransferase [Gammaproteobacteria bacterium]